MATFDAKNVNVIRRHLQQHPYGPERFRQAIEAQLSRTVGPQKIGRGRQSQWTMRGKVDSDQCFSCPAL
jgi:putative transposase